MSTEKIIVNLQAKLARQEQAAQETRDHIALLKEIANKDQQPLPLQDAGKPPKR